jgi:hypothetical protein
MSKLAPSLLALALAACNGGTENTTEATDATGGGTTDATTSPGTSTAPTTGGGAGMVVLNEISSGGALTGSLMGRDVIELHNLGDAQVDLSGFRLSDDPLLPADKTYVFPAGIVIAPGGWLVLSQLDDMAGTGDFPFGIAQDQEETIVLADGGGTVVDTVTFDGADAIVSYCRLPDGVGAWVKCDQTFEAANAGASNMCGDGVLGPPEQCDGTDIGPATCEALGFMGGALDCRFDCTHDTHGCDGGSELVINELESVDDQIELYNGGPDIDISGWILTDAAGGPGYDPDADVESLTFATGTELAAGAYFLIPKGTLKNQHPFGLGADGDTVTLMRPNFSIADQVKYGPGEADISYCRIPDGPDGEWMPMCKATPGASNAI